VDGHLAALARLQLIAVALQVGPDRHSCGICGFKAAVLCDDEAGLRQAWAVTKRDMGADLPDPTHPVSLCSAAASPRVQGRGSKGGAVSA
jgi:hypothetical protein